MITGNWKLRLNWGQLANTNLKWRLNWGQLANKKGEGIDGKHVMIFLYTRKWWANDKRTRLCMKEKGPKTPFKRDRNEHLNAKNINNMGEKCGSNDIRTGKTCRQWMKHMKLSVCLSFCLFVYLSDYLSICPKKGPMSYVKETYVIWNFEEDQFQMYKKGKRKKDLCHM